MSEIAARLENVSKTYHLGVNSYDALKRALGFRKNGGSGRPFKALNSLSLEFRQGEAVGIIGRNGAGKSTILQILCGVLSPDQGRIELSGRVCALLELGSGFNPEFTGRENILLNGVILGMTREEVEAKLEDIIAFSEIGQFIDEPVKTYSSGMYVRLAFSVVAHADADILVVDEALAVGDVFFSQKCVRFMRSFAKTGTLVFVSHDTATVQAICDRVVWIDQGKVRMDGTPDVVVPTYLSDLNYGAVAVEGHTPGTVDAMSPEPVDESSYMAGELDVPVNGAKGFRFNRNSPSFGNGGALVQSAEILGTGGRAVASLRGGESVRLKIRAEALEKIESPIIGFEVYDRTGQVVFASNTYLSNTGVQVLEQGDMAVAIFSFKFPVLKPGDYVVSIAIANGTQDAHQQQHWMNEAMVFSVSPSSTCLGMFEVPMTAVLFEKERGCVSQ